MLQQFIVEYTFSGSVFSLPVKTTQSLLPHLVGHTLHFYDVTLSPAYMNFISMVAPLTLKVNV